MSSDLMQNIETIAGHELNGRHSYFQLKHFLIGKEPTIQSKLWRCVRELQGRKESINSINLEIEEVEDQLELINIPAHQFGIDPMDSKFSIRKRERQNKALSYQLEILKRRLVGLEQEAEFFVRTFEALETVEKLKSFDDLESQKQYWEAKLTLELKIKNSAFQDYDPEVIKTILALPENCKIQNEVVTQLLLDNKDNYDIQTIDVK